MNKDTYKTRVQFLYHDANEDLFAFFVDEIETTRTRLGYSHIGQHTQVSTIYATEAREATHEEYKALKQELEGLGYNLDVINQ